MPPSVFPSTTGSKLLPQNCASVMGAPATIAIGMMNLRTATGVTRCPRTPKHQESAPRAAKNHRQCLSVQVR